MLILSERDGGSRIISAHELIERRLLGFAPWPKPAGAGFPAQFVGEGRPFALPLPQVTAGNVPPGVVGSCAAGAVFFSTSSPAGVVRPMVPIEVTK
jgi:hypothetical protein